MQEKLRQAEEAIDRLQKMNKTSIIPTISKLESDVALMANSAKKQGSSLQQAQNVIIWIVDNCFMRHATGKIDLSKSSSVLLDLEAGVPPQKQQSTSHVVSGFVMGTIILIICFGLAWVATMFLVPDFEMSQAWGWIPVWNHDRARITGPAIATNYREDPL